MSTLVAPRWNPLFVLVLIGVGLGVGSAACGYSNPGEGTGTLVVQGALDSSFATLATQLRFVVTQNAAAVPDATITLVDADSREAFVVPFDRVNNSYQGTWPGLHRRTTVEVSRGGDSMKAQVEGPSRHTVAHPHAGAVLRLQDALDVRWATEDGVRADRVFVVVSDADREIMRHTLTHDSGQDHIVSAALGPSSVLLTVSRETELVPRGGAEGSALLSRYSVSTQVVRQ